MKKKLYLHIGIGKTGTTSIQEMLLNNADKLLENHILYPKTGIVQYGHHGLATLEEQRFSAETSNKYQVLREEIEASPAQIIVISSENFSFMTHDYIADVATTFADFDVKIVFYVREQIKLFASSYLEWIKVGKEHNGSEKDFFEWHKYSFDFMRRIEPWEKAFGQDNIMVRLFDKQIIGDNVCRDFLAFLNIQTAMQMADEQANPSLAPDMLELIYYLDSLSLSKEQRQNIIDHLLILSAKLDRSKSEPLFDAQYKNTIYDFYAQSNQDFAQRYLHGIEKDLLLTRP